MAGIYVAEDMAVSITEPPIRSTSSHLILIALFISIILHLTIVAWYKPAPAMSVQFPRSEASALRIKLVPVKKAEATVDPASITASPAIPQTITEPESEPDKQAVSTPTIRRRPEDLQTTIQRSSVFPDNYRLTQEDLALPSMKSAEADEIFDPRLREKLQAARKLRRLGAVAPTEVTTLHGETIITLDEGSCMSSNGREDSVTRASDWYFTNCNGVKTEGELMMERVNQKIRANR